MIRISAEDCIGCGKCMEVCPEDALDLEDDVAKVDEDLCISCGTCVSVCPVEAIEPLLEVQRTDLSGYSGVWVFAEQHEGRLRPTGPELLGKGRELATELGEDLCAVLMGHDVAGLCEELAARGADRVYLVQDEALASYSTQAYTTALIALISRHRPSMLIYGATHVGRDLAPAVAGRMGLGLTADCTGLSVTEVDGNKVLLQTRPAFGGNVMADIVCPNTRPQMATVRPHVMEPLEPDPGRQAEVVEEEVKLDPAAISVEVLEVLEPEETGEISVEEADFVVSGGRGVGNKEDFGLLEDLASQLGGAVGCSRPMVEEDVMPKSRQVGQSGKTVSPEIYIACGISGAVQHQVGIRGARHIIAINSDPGAPIFDIADFGIVGDYRRVVPLLMDALKDKMQE